ncbi:hypothetical protein NL513_28440, partial [Klebsiella pneumoniae]|nr:hypothetical protein [Klebsiella pneumoniae]
AQLKAEEDKDKLLKKERRRIRLSIKNNMQPLVKLVTALSEFQNTLSGRIGLNSIDELQTLKKSIDDYSEILQGYSLSPLPTSLGRLEDEY